MSGGGRGGFGMAGEVGDGGAEGDWKESEWRVGMAHGGRRGVRVRRRRWGRHAVIAGQTPNTEQHLGVLTGQRACASSEASVRARRAGRRGLFVKVPARAGMLPPLGCLLRGPRRALLDADHVRRALWKHTPNRWTCRAPTLLARRCVGECPVATCV
jgi:hypothetical protein